MGIMALYGFDPMDHGATRKPTTLKDFIAIGVVAVQYKIEGLLDTALEITSNILTECLSHEDEDDVDHALKHFLGFKWSEMLNDGRCTPLVMKTLKEHLPEINKTSFFKELLDMEPLLARCLFDAMVEDQAQRAKR